MALARMIGFTADKIVGNLLEATRKGIDETTEAVAEDTRGTSMDLPPHTAAGHRWYGVTPRVEEEIDNQAAKVEGTSVVGRVGYTKARGGYGLMLDRLHPTVRPAFDREAPKLAKRIKDNL